MAVPLLVGDILEFVVVAYMDDQIGENAFHAQVTALTAGSPTDLVAAKGFDTLMAPLYKTCINIQATYRGVSCRILRAGNPFAPATTVANAGSGSSSNNALPGQNRGLISYKTALAGPAYRGRTYVPFPSALAITTNGDLATSYVTAVNAIGSIIAGGSTPLIDGASTVTVIFGVYHRNPPTPPRTLPVQGTLTPIITRLTRPFFATQRRSGGFGRTNALPF